VEIFGSIMPGPGIGAVDAFVQTAVFADGTAAEAVGVLAHAGDDAVGVALARRLTVEVFFGPYKP